MLPETWLNLSSFLGLSAGAWITTGVLVLMVGGLVAGRVGADLVLLSGLAALLATGVLTPSEALQGFANPGLATVAFLYVVTTGLRETGAIEQLIARALGRPKSERAAQARLAAPVAVASAFVNNTPVVAMFLPTLSAWAKRNGFSASRFFMPLSFAAILGGMCTLIGTSTNLVVNALINDHLPSAGVEMAPFGMFTLAVYGVPAALAGLVYMLLFAPRLLRTRGDAGPLETDPKEYMTALRVGASSPVVGKSVETAGLRQLSGLFLSRLERGDETFIAVSPDQTLRAGDVLVFVGAVESVVDVQRTQGLEPIADEVGGRTRGPRHTARLVETVISRSSPLIGSTIREGAFRTRYDAVVIAVHRNGERLRGKIGDIELRPGDTLLLEAAQGFAARHRNSNDFYLVTELPGAASPRHSLAGVALTILVCMVGFITWRPEHAATAALVGALAMVLFRCCTGPEARASIDWQVLLVIGAAFGLGAAMEKTGLAASLAHELFSWATQQEMWVALAAVFAITAVFTQIVTNNAAAVLMFPVALEAAKTADMPFTPFAVCIALAASAGFATPIGYQTNLMVQGPGGYRSGDFLRFGAPLVFIVGLVTVAVASMLWSGG